MSAPCKRFKHHGITSFPISSFFLFKVHASGRVSSTKQTFKKLNIGARATSSTNVKLKEFSSLFGNVESLQHDELYF